MGKRWNCLSLPDFRCERHSRIKRELERKPFAITTYERQSLRIVAASPLARRGGVAAGMSLSEARAIIPQLLAIEEGQEADQYALEGLAGWANQFTPYVSIYAETLMLDVTGTAHLFNGETMLMRKALLSLKRLGYEGKGAVAHTPLAALALVRGSRNAVSVADEDSLGQLPVAVLPLEPKAESTLHALGLYTIGQVLALPNELLASRFGDDFCHTVRKFTGDKREVPPPYTVQHQMTERMEFETPLNDGQSVLFVVKRLSDRIAERLSGKAAGACGLNLLFTYVSSPHDPEILKIGMSQALSKAASLFTLLRTKLESFEIEEDVEAIELRVTDHAPAKRHHRDLFTSKSEQDEENLVDLLDRLSARLGSRQVSRIELVDDHRPERSWTREPFTAEVSGEATTFTKQRPARLQEVPIEVVVLTEEGFPRSMIYHGHEHRIIQSVGPERIINGWWDGEAQRDYYSICLDDGSWLWVYHDLTTGQWFQHGEYA